MGKNNIEFILCTLLFLFFLGACTDYVEQIDNQIESIQVAQKNVIKGSVVDSRDGRIYKTVTIGSQTWMAENLNYEIANSYCYNNDLFNCSRYGRLYTWAAAMDSVGVWSPNGKGCGYGVSCIPAGVVYGVCPSGWHLPTMLDFDTLIAAVGGPFMAGKMLKSSSGWTVSGNGMDVYSFSAIPAGFLYAGTYSYEGDFARFWSSTDENDGEYAFFLDLGYNTASVNYGRDLKFYGASIRCKKNNDLAESISDVIFNDTKGVITDSRDGQSYKIVKIGDLWWMAQNLNYESTNSFCYNDDSVYCKKYGRLYTWAAAMDSAGLWSVNGKGCGVLKMCSPIYPVRGVCPSGWHLPSYAEFVNLFNAVGGISLAGKVLKSTNEWNNNGNGNDDWDFSALPAGGWYAEPRFYDTEGDNTEFWSSTGRDHCISDSDDDCYWAYRMYLGAEQDFGSVELYAKKYRFSVRCVMD